MKRIDLPSMGEMPKPKKRKRKATAKQQSGNTITAEIPTKQTDNYQTESVFLRRLTKGQKRGLSLLFHGAISSGKTLENNRPVKHPVDAMRWLLEQINDSVGEK